MSKKRNLRERIWAVVLAAALLLTSILPNAAMLAQAADVESSISFHVTEKLNAGQPDETSIALSGAAVKILCDGEVVLEGTTAADGNVTLAGTFDDTKTYGYTVEKTGYETITSGTLDISGAQTENVEMQMEEIQVSPGEVVLKLDSTEENTASISINNKIDNPVSGEPGYGWKSADENVAVFSDGIITAKGRGQDVVSVYRNNESKDIKVTVKEELESMAISVIPGTDGGITTDVDGVEISVTGMEAAKGDVQIYVSGVDGAIGTIQAPYTSGLSYNNPDVLKGNVQFTAKYTAPEGDYYFDKEVSTGVISYKKNYQLGLADSASEVTYGETETLQIVPVSETIQGREITYESNNPDVAAVDNSGNVEIKGQGTANITVKAWENDEYLASDAVYTVTVKKKPISIVAGDVKWNPVSKIYDGEKKIQLTGTVVGNTAVKAGDTITVTADAELADNAAGSYAAAKLLSIQAENSNYEVTFDAVAFAANAELTGLDIKVEQRPIYIKVQKKDETSVTDIEYGKIAAEISEVCNLFEAVPAGTNGQLHPEETEGVVSGEEETVNAMLSKVEIVQNELDNSAYVGIYQKALKPKLPDAKDTGNYAVQFEEADEQYYGSINVVQEVTDNDALWGRIAVKKTDGTLPYTANGTIWVKNGDSLEFGNTDNNYTDVNVKLNDGTYSNKLTVDEKGDTADITNDVYLSNKNDAEAPLTRTTSSQTEADQDNQIPAGKIKADNKLPEVEFKSLNMSTESLVNTAFKFGSFTKFLNSEHVETVTIKDEESGYIPSNQKYKILGLSKDADASAAILASVKQDGWNEIPEAGITVPAAAEGYYVVLVKAVDNVGNEAVYASNGIVVDLSKPSVNLVINTDSSAKGEYNQDVEYTITVTDPATSAVSGIDRIEVEVTCDGNPVAGDAAQHTNTYTLDSTTLNQLKGIGDENGDSDGYSVNDLEEKAQYEIQGTILKDSCNSNDVKITVTAYDQAGNPAGETQERELVIDKTAPQITSIVYDSTEKDNCYQERTMTITYQERNFDPTLAKFEIVENENDKDAVTKSLAELMSEADKVDGITVSKLSDSPEESFSDKRLIVYELKFGPQEGKDITYKITPSIEDTAGNVEEIKNRWETQEFTIDNLLPTIDVTFDNNDMKNGKYFKDTRTMTVAFTERNYDEDLVTFDLTVNGGETITKKMSEWKNTKDSENAITVSECKGESNVHTYTITFGADGKDIDYEIVPHITDKADNVNTGITYAEGTEAGQEFTVDMVAPVISVKYRTINPAQDITEDIGEQKQDSMYKNADVAADIFINERNFAAQSNSFEKMELTQTAVDAVGNKIEGAPDYTNDIQNAGRWETANLTAHSISLDYTAEANYSLALTYEDLAGNPAKEYGVHYFTVDKTAPTASMTIKENTFESFLDKITFHFFEKLADNQYISTTVKDDISSVKTSYYKYEPGIEARNEFSGLSEGDLKNLGSWTALVEKYEVANPEKTYTYGIENPEQIVPYEKIEDKAGNITYINANGIICEDKEAAISVKINTSAPKTSFEVKPEDVVYNSNVEFTIHVSDEAEKAYSGLKEVSYEIRSNGSVTQSGNYNDELNDETARVPKLERTETIEAELNNSNNVEIYVTAEDYSGNTVTYRYPENEKDTLKIDTTKPKIISVEYDNNDVHNGKYFNADRTMTIQYKERNINQAGLTFDFAVGKEDPKRITLADLKKVPEVDVELCEDTQGTTAVKDLTDDRTVTYNIKFAGGENGDMDYSIVPYIEDQASNKNTDDNGNYVVTYADNTVAREEFTIDKTKPTMEVAYYLVNDDGSETKIPVSTDEINRLYKNKTIRAKVTIEERNFGYDDKFADGQMKLDVGWVKHDGKIGSTTAYSASAEDCKEWATDALNTNTRTQTFEFKADGDYSFNMEYVDLAGNSLKQKYPTHYFTIDTVAPAVNVTYMVDGQKLSAEEVQKINSSRLYKNKAITATVEIEERNFARQNSDTVFEEGQMNLEYTAANLAGNEVKVENYTGSANTRNKWTSSDYKRTQTFSFTVDANYVMSLVYKDLAGNACNINKQYFTVDTVAPRGDIIIPSSEQSTGGNWHSDGGSWIKGIWTKLIRIYYDQFFTKQNHTSTMKGQDETSGVEGIWYYIDNRTTGAKQTESLSVEELNQIKDWKVYEGGITVSPESQSAYYGKVVDKAGNVTYLNAMFGVIADDVQPELSLSVDPSCSARNGIYSSDVIINVSVTDPKVDGVYAGVKSVTYHIESTTNVVGAEDGRVMMIYSNSSEERNWSGNGSIRVNAQAFNSNNVTVRVTAEDNAGNVYTAEMPLAIDVTAPVIENISWNTSAASNGKYYNVTRVATISVRERNFDPNEVRLNITNTDGTMPQISGWSVDTSGTSDNNLNTCTVTFAADGDYNMNVSCTDKAGWNSNTQTIEEFTIDKTAPTINVTFDNNNVKNGKYYNAARTATITVNEHNFNGSEVQTAISSNTVTPGVYGWSGGDVHTATVPFTTDGNYAFTVNYTDLAGNAAQAYTVNEFVIDLTKPEVEIFDIVDKSANNGEVAPGVRYSDTNYDVNGVSITYSGAKHAEKAVDGTRTGAANGESIKMADFEHTQETDDVYTMVAKVTDLAGNSDEKQVTFSVNRFGSNFIFSDETEEFLDDYYNNEEETLVVTEINVDTLTHRGISCGHDGDMTDFEEGTDYTVKASGGEVSWKSYQYTIKKDNFEEEGLYNITIDSVDRATNQVNNKIKEAEIEFVIDKTAPTVVITGVENNGQYRMDTRDITISSTDNVAMDKAGNIADTSRSEGSKEGKWLSVLVTSNFFVQIYRNTALMIGIIVVLLLLLIFLFLILAKRRKKDEETAE